MARLFRLFSRRRFFIIQRCVHGVPWQGGALNSNRKFTHAGKYFQITETVSFDADIEFAGDHAVKLAEQLFGFLLCLAFDGLRHHAGCGLGDRAARALESYFPDRVIFQIQIDGQLIATQWIETFCRVVSRLEPAKVSRFLIVVENDLLVELA